MAFGERGVGYGHMIMDSINNFFWIKEFNQVYGTGSVDVMNHTNSYSSFWNLPFYPKSSEVNEIEKTLTS